MRVKASRGVPASAEAPVHASGGGRSPPAGPWRSASTPRECRCRGPRSDSTRSPARPPRRPAGTGTGTELVAGAGGHASGQGVGNRADMKRENRRGARRGANSSLVPSKVRVDCGGNFCAGASNPLDTKPLGWLIVQSDLCAVDGAGTISRLESAERRWVVVVCERGWVGKQRESATCRRWQNGPMLQTLQATFRRVDGILAHILPSFTAWSEPRNWLCAPAARAP